jgi:hypothetical protein
MTKIGTEAPLGLFSRRLRRTVDGTTLSKMPRRLDYDVTVHGMRSCSRSWCADHRKAGEMVPFPTNA